MSCNNFYIKFTFNNFKNKPPFISSWEWSNTVCFPFGLRDREKKNEFSNTLPYPYQFPKQVNPVFLGSPVTLFLLKKILPAASNTFRSKKY